MIQEGIPGYLRIEAVDLGRGTDVRVTILGDAQAVAGAMAAEMFAVIQAALASRGQAVLIVPVGPVDQFPILAQLINAGGVSLRQTVIINMDEYLDDTQGWVSWEHPLSFRSFMERNFYSLLHKDLAPPEENRVFPDPARPEAIGRLIESRGQVDACFGGIGINGHIAFNEPPEPGENISLEEFANLPARVLPLARESRTINSVTVGGGMEVVPRWCVTVGMREILAAKKLRFFCNRPWQAAVVRRVLHGPITSACPASLLRTHPDAALGLADFVAAKPQIGLR
ncbi:MAG: glucosamine-6-phosphate isomerase [Gemmataceae bacterium]|nr:glucosamine-6-phosphate isomerase [Gemmataceae bacterium]